MEWKIHMDVKKWEIFLFSNLLDVVYFSLALLSRGIFGSFRLSVQFQFESARRMFKIGILIWRKLTEFLQAIARNTFANCANVTNAFLMIMILQIKLKSLRNWFHSSTLFRTLPRPLTNFLIHIPSRLITFFSFFPFHRRSLTRQKKITSIFHLSLAGCQHPHTCRVPLTRSADTLFKSNCEWMRNGNRVAANLLFTWRKKKMSE